MKRHATRRDVRNKRARVNLHALNRRGSQLQWAYFEILSEDLVHVTALIGLTEYIDRAMTRSEARAEWSRLKASGWTQRTLKDASREMPLRTLRTHIYG